MLVCHVSMRPRRSGIVADLAETATAVDAPGTGNVVFATLVDDPASVVDYVDAYLGEIMVEAANADAVVDSGLGFGVAIDEAVTAADALDGTVSTGPVLTPRSAMLLSEFVNSPGTPRKANVNGVMVNL